MESEERIMDFKQEEGRIWLDGPQGQMIAEVTFPRNEDGTVTITHTFVDDSLRGQGVAGQLMKLVAEHLRQNGRKAHLTSPYARGWFPKHPEYGDVLA